MSRKKTAAPSEIVRVERQWRKLDDGWGLEILTITERDISIGEGSNVDPRTVARRHHGGTFAAFSRLEPVGRLCR